jgi:hypothetical protein
MLAHHLVEFTRIAVWSIQLHAMHLDSKERFSDQILRVNICLQIAQVPVRPVFSCSLAHFLQTLQ